MNARAIGTAIAAYTVLAGAVTVAGVYFLTHSGLYVIGTGGVGVLLVVLGGAQGVGGTFATGAEVETDVETDAGDVPIGSSWVRGAAGGLGLRVALLCYGLGLFLWAAVAVSLFGSSLR
ncbi:hypothetical protein ACFQE1_17945 [Halobium palmae]|uniref:DUF8070 domain-containing protein n=1 Tax=Halobium palmae TaxID=1776492 RepID=A0ABD5S3M9_9EURY